MAELVHSIREVGLLQPVVVRRTGDDVLRAGHGRAAVARGPGGRARDDPGDRARRPTTPTCCATHSWRTSTGRSSTRWRRRRPTSSCSRTSPAPTTSWPRGSAGRGRRSATRSGCSSSRRRSSAGSRPASSRPGMPGRCSPIEDADLQDRLAARVVAEGISVRGLEEIVAVGDPAAEQPPVRRRKPTAPGLERPRRAGSRIGSRPGSRSTSVSARAGSPSSSPRSTTCAGSSTSWIRATGRTAPSDDPSTALLSTKRSVDRTTSRCFRRSAACCGPRSARPSASPRRPDGPPRRAVGAAAAVRRRDPPGAVLVLRIARDRLVEQPLVATASARRSRRPGRRRRRRAALRSGSRSRCRGRGPWVVLGHQPLGAPEHQRHQGDAGRGGDPDGSGLEVLDLHRPRDRGLGEDADQLAARRGSARRRPARDSPVGPVDLDVAAGPHDRARDPVVEELRAWP